MATCDPKAACVLKRWAVQIDQSLPHFPLQEWCDRPSPAQAVPPQRFDLPSGARDCASLSRTLAVTPSF